MDEVLIVGAGPIGLTLGCDLLRRGIPVRIVDQNSGHSTHSKAIAIQPRTLELLHIMGIAPQLLEKGLPLRGITIHTKQTEHKALFSVLDTPYPFILSLQQSQTEEILGEYFTSLGGTIEWNTKWPFESSCRWIMACDGGRSALRKSAGAQLGGKTYEDTAIVADVTLNTPLPSDTVHVFSRRGKAGILMNMPGNQLRIILLTSKKSSLAEEIQQCDIDDPLDIKEVLWESEFKTNALCLDEMRYGNTFFLGDAAHVHSPMGGQGMNMGIQDALNLSWKLELVLKGQAYETLLDTYSLERVPVVKKLLHRIDFLTHHFALLEPKLRNVAVGGLGFLLKLKPFAHRIPNVFSQLSVNYRGSPLVNESKEDAESWKEGPKPGDRAPIVTLSDGTHLLDRLQKTAHHVVLIFEENEPLRKILEQEYGVFLQVVIVKDESAREKYAAGPDTLYLIRPDGFISYRSQHFKIVEVISYLYRIFKPWAGRATHASQQ